MATVAHFSLAEYERMVKLGAFDAVFRRRLELLRGEIVEMSPIGSRHAYTIDPLTDWSYGVAPRSEIAVRVQNPIRVPVSDSEPEPGVVWAIRKNYSDRHPEPDDVLLVIEVADSSLELDRGEKLSIYAEASIPEYWIVNLLDRQIEVHRNPSGRAYQSSNICHGADAISPMSLPEAKLFPASLFEAR
jgi:Uma2 family endonuclease